MNREGRLAQRTVAIATKSTDDERCVTVTRVTKNHNYITSQCIFTLLVPFNSINLIVIAFGLISNIVNLYLFFITFYILIDIEQIDLDFWGIIIQLNWWSDNMK